MEWMCSLTVTRTVLLYTCETLTNKYLSLYLYKCIGFMKRVYIIGQLGNTDRLYVKKKNQTSSSFINVYVSKCL